MHFTRFVDRMPDWVPGDFVFLEFDLANKERVNVIPLDMVNQNWAPSRSRTIRLDRPSGLSICPADVRLPDRATGGLRKRDRRQSPHRYRRRRKHKAECAPKPCQGKVESSAFEQSRKFRF